MLALLRLSHSFLRQQRLRLPTVVRSYTNKRSDIQKAWRPPQKGDTVILGLSGGVDSSVSAYLLQQQGFNVHAVYMHNWNLIDETPTACPSSIDFADAQKVCEVLGVQLTRVDFSKEYWTLVFEEFLKEVESGRTPNPDVLCNRYVKFGVFARRFLSPVLGSSKDESRKLGGGVRGDWIATGHYAAVERDVERGIARLVRAQDKNKDQSYYLSNISETILSRSLFPLSNLSKPSVKLLAQQIGLPTAQKPESMGICFIGPRPLSSFLEEYIPPVPCTLVDPSGNVKDRRENIHAFTLGQGARLQGEKEKWYVASKNLERREVLVVPGKEHGLLWRKEIQVGEMVWISDSGEPEELRENEDGWEVEVRVRHRSEPVKAMIRRKNGKKEGVYAIHFKKPQTGLAPGQAIQIMLSTTTSSAAPSTGGAIDMQSVTKRLQSELMQLMMAGVPGVSAFPESENLLNWVGTIEGPSNTVYEGLTYKLSLKFPHNYPYAAPTIRFETPMYHPNVDTHGNICLDILKEKWSAVYNVQTVLLSLQSLLGEPNNDSPLNVGAAEMWGRQEEFKAMVKSVWREI
ncbi:hypothetical protein HDV05_003911 [Chytridiales sp. JEL 0842]|nr:hypothetical protein HDV05_003911 [Chytridiales sp. JEL 0842]